MLRYLLLSAFLLSGCGGKTRSGQPSAIAWKLPANQSLAYRFSGQGSAVLDGEDQEDQEFTGYVFIDVDGDGKANIRLDAGQPIFGMTSMALDPGASNFFFPMPGSPMSNDPITQSFTIQGLGTTATQTHPSIEVSETLTRTADDGATATLTFTRKGSGAGGTPLAVLLEEQGKGTFDREAGRYRRLERTTTMKVSGDFAGKTMDLALTVTFILEFDAERSKARTQETARLRGPPVSAEELTRYLAENPASAELAGAIRDLDSLQTNAVLFFHLRANPVATWQAAMTLPAEEADSFVSSVGFQVGHGGPLPQALIDWLKAELPKQPGLENAIANLPDERLREQLVSLSAMTDPDKEWIARQAKDSLAAIDAQKAGPTALLQASDDEFMRVGHALQEPGQDHRPLVPVLIEILERATKSANSSSGLPRDEVVVQWLEVLVSRSFGKDVAAWKSFWQANQGKPYCQWMIEAAGQDTPMLVQNALSRLGFCQGSREAVEYLARRMREDSGDTRSLAALALSRHKDRRAIPVLIDMLADDNQQSRNLALLALANFHTTTLGYDPAGDEAGRAAALRRWRAWAKAPAPGASPQ